MKSAEMQMPRRKALSFERAFCSIFFYGLNKNGRVIGDSIG